METRTRFFENLYDNFNKRNIDIVISQMTSDVEWANGMEGGFVTGHHEVKEYWTRQFQQVSSNVKPMEILETNNEIIIKVHQVVRDLEGNLLADQIVTHAFRMQGDKIAWFDIR